MRSQFPSFTIVVRAYNASRYIEQAVHSVYRQTYQGPVELLVLYDEGSSDDTLSVLYRLSDEFKNSHVRPNIKFRLERHTHMTLLRATLLGLKLSTTDYVIFLDYDNVMPENYLETVAEELSSDPSVGFAFTKALLIDAEGRSLGRGLVQMPENPYDIRELIKGNYIDANTMVFSAVCAKTLYSLVSSLTSRYLEDAHPNWLLALLALRHCAKAHSTRLCAV